MNIESRLISKLKNMWMKHWPAIILFGENRKMKQNCNLLSKMALYTMPVLDEVYSSSDSDQEIQLKQTEKTIHRGRELASSASTSWHRQISNK